MKDQASGDHALNVDDHSRQLASGSESCQNAGTLLDSLLAILRLDFACAPSDDSIDGSPVEVVRWPSQHPSAQPQEVGRAARRWLSGDKTARVCDSIRREGESRSRRLTWAFRTKLACWWLASATDFPNRH